MLKNCSPQSMSWVAWRRENWKIWSISLPFSSCRLLSSISAVCKMGRSEQGLENLIYKHTNVNSHEMSKTGVCIRKVQRIRSKFLSSLCRWDTILKSFAGGGDSSNDTRDLTQGQSIWTTSPVLFFSFLFNWSKLLRVALYFVSSCLSLLSC